MVVVCVFTQEDATWLSSAIDTLIITAGALLGLGIADTAFDKKQENSIFISDEELEARRAKWQPREPKITTGYLKRYAELVTSGNRGAVLELPKK